MDIIKGKIDEVVNKVKSDPEFAKKFTSDPVKALEGVIGVDLPDEQVKGIIDGVTKNVSAGDVVSKLASGDIAGTISGILGGKKD
ncbi:MAG: hypothetical protein V3G42_03840 [Oscillospiraceae bacterium]